ncbi:MAG: hypothetical protein AAB358_03860 [Patescibacteria group bacterium]
MIKENRKTIFQQAIKTSDLVKIGVLLIFSIICWVWVYFEYQKPIEINFNGSAETGSSIPN